MKKIPYLIFFIFLFGNSLVFAENKWSEHKAQHFIIYYTNAPMDFVKSVEEMAEQYYVEITDNLGFTRYRNWSFDDRAKIYIYDGQDDYVASAKLMKWSHGAASAVKKEIWTFPTAHGFFDSTLPHELGHIIFREFIGPYAQVPLWLEEGVAMFQEKAKRWGTNKIVREAISRGTFIPLNELTWMALNSQTPKNEVDLFYAESANIVYFLITEFGEQRFVNFCRKLKQGAGFDNSLTFVYTRFRNIDDLNKAWRKYLDE